MVISKDEILGKWVVWKVKGRGWFMMFSANTKKECKEWFNKHTKRRK